MSTFEAQLERMRTGKGFVAALDQSGGSTPKALANYGITEEAYSNDEEMFQLVYAMRTRIVTSPAFDHRVIGAILFEKTLDRDIEDKPSAHYLWQNKNVVPFLKVDKGMETEAVDDVHILKPIPTLNDALEKAKTYNVFGTKMRSVINLANKKGIKAIVDQQFDLAHQIITAGLVPIVEPEVDKNSPEKAEAEAIMVNEIRSQIEKLDSNQLVMLKINLPEAVNLYQEFVDHPNVVRVLAMSGGYPQTEGVAKLKENNGVIASFSRGLVEGLSAQQTDEEFTQTLNDSIEAIYQASIT